MSHAFKDGGSKDRSWLANVLHIPETIASQSDKLSELRGADATQWTQFVANDPVAALKVFRKVFEGEDFNLSKFWWPKSTTNSNRDGALVTIYDDPTTFCCGESNCEYSCNTIQGLHWHYYEVHRTKNEAPYS